MFLPKNPLPESYQKMYSAKVVIKTVGGMSKRESKTGRRQREFPE